MHILSLRLVEHFVKQTQPCFGPNMFDEQAFTPRRMGDHHIRHQALLSRGQRPMQHRLTPKGFRLRIHQPWMNLRGAAALGPIGVHLNTAPGLDGLLGHEKGMHLVSQGAQRRGEVFELTREILVKKKDFQSV